MKEMVAKYLARDYLFMPVTETRFDLLYLALALLLISAPIILRIIIKIKFKDRPKKVYATFDRLWFWLSFSLGLFGLFIYFSRIQGLPFFGTRFASYLFLFLILAAKLGITFYYKMYIPKKLKRYHELARKKRYLKG
jgi:hypothetical protein